jgi:hypothetical protein
MKRNKVQSNVEANEAIYKLIGNKTDRTQIIESLSLLEVEKYLVIIKEMQDFFKNILDPMESLIAARTVYSSAKGMTYMGYTVTFHTLPSLIIQPVISPEPPIAELSATVMELQQRKIILEHLNKTRKHILRAKMVKHLELLNTSQQNPLYSNEEKTPPSSSFKVVHDFEDGLTSELKEEEQDYIYDTLESYHQLLHTCEKLRTRTHNAETELKQDKQTLEETLTRDIKNQQELEGTKQQLSESQKSNTENTMRLAELTESRQQLDTQIQGLHRSNEQLKEQVQRLEIGLSLFNKIQNPCFESKDEPSEVYKITITKKDIKLILLKNHCKLGSGLFSCSKASDDSLICLQSLLKTKKASFSYNEMKDCIKNDAILQVFVKPLECKSKYPGNVVSVFRDIALHFATSLLLLIPDNQQAAQLSYN